MIEVRPPNVMIRDFSSTNGTFVRRKGRGEWERIDETLVYDGDQIKVGHTILSASIVQPELIGLETYYESVHPPALVEKEEETPPPAIEAEPEARIQQPPPEPGPRVEPSPVKKKADKPEILCIRCGAVLEIEPLIPTGGPISQELFMCANCRQEVEAERKREETARAAVVYKCQHCGTDVSKAANSDGQAAQLSEAAFYLCKSCAERSAKLRMPPIGDYRPLAEIGRGGMGIVYKAWHLPTGRVAALKQMLPIPNADPTLVRRFYREVLINQQLIHPGLVRLFGTGLDGDHPYFVSEFVPDGNLNQFLSPEDRPLLQPMDAARLIALALEGLEHVHQKGFVHRDIKPENILLRARGNGDVGAKSVRNLQPKLADFGLARSYERSGGTITRKGEYAGTIFYMPAEQIIAFKQSRPPVDIYAMGVTLYFLLTGRFPLEFPSPYQLKRGARLKKDPIRMILEDQPRPVRSQRPDLPAALCAVVDRSVIKDADQRYQTAGEFRADLLKVIGS
jgi:DNA-directed RNA polymerase subunit RPC12/RpoP